MVLARLDVDVVVVRQDEHAPVLVKRFQISLEEGSKSALIL